MNCNFIGYEKNVSKSGNVGYVFYFTCPVSDGEGVKPLQVYSFGKWSFPYLSEDKARPFIPSILHKALAVSRLILLVFLYPHS